MKITTPDEFMKTLANGGASEESVAPNLFGRIMKGFSPDDFQRLSNDPSRNLISVMGSDGLEAISKTDGFEALMQMGLRAHYVEWLIKHGAQFKLVVFKENPQHMRLADWGNVMDLTCEMYPELADKLRPNLGKLKHYSFKEIEESTGYTFSAIYVNPEHPLYMTPERLLERVGNVADARAFFYFTTRLYELYRGDGYTYDEYGDRRSREFIMRNCNLNDLVDYKVVDFPVEVPAAH